MKEWSAVENAIVEKLKKRQTMSSTQENQDLEMETEEKEQEEEEELKVYEDDEDGLDK